MTKHRKILNLISIIRESHSEIEKIYTKGSCLNFFLILHSIYPESEPYYNVDHVITKIDNKFYDITGCVSGKGYSKFSNFYNKKRISRAFTQMLKYQYAIENFPCSGCSPSLV